MEILQSANYNVPDGNGLFVASMMQEENKNFISACFSVFFDKKRTYIKYGELIKWSDLTEDILEQATKRKQKIMIIDKKNNEPKNEFERKKAEMQKNLKQILSEKYPNNEFFIIFDRENIDTISKIIQEEDIDFIFSCLWMKTQEEVLVKIFEKLDKEQKVVGLGVGASIDFLLGLQKRAPKFFRDLWLEWFYRLIIQPKIRYKRIKTALIDFPKLIKNNKSELHNSCYRNSK